MTGPALLKTIDPVDIMRDSSSRATVVNNVFGPNRM